MTHSLPAFAVSALLLTAAAPSSPAFAQRALPEASDEFGVSVTQTGALENELKADQNRIPLGESTAGEADEIRLDRDFDLTGIGLEKPSDAGADDLNQAAAGQQTIESAKNAIAQFQGVKPCRPNQLRMRTRSAPTEGFGTQAALRSGLMVTLVNISRQKCTVPGLPLVNFRTFVGIKLPIERQTPRGFMPGPVILPRVLEPYGSLSDRASMTLSWLSSNISGAAKCLRPASIAVHINGFSIRRKFHSSLKNRILGLTKKDPDLRPTLCPPKASRPIVFSQSSLQVAGQPSLP